MLVTVSDPTLPDVVITTVFFLAVLGSLNVQPPAPVPLSACWPSIAVQLTLLAFAVEPSES